LLNAVLGERIAKAVLRQRLHAGDRLGQQRRRQRHQHLVVEHAAVAPLGEAGNRQARLARFKRAAPGIGAGGFAHHAPVKALVARPLQAVDEVDHRARRGVEQRDVGRVEPSAGAIGVTRARVEPPTAAVHLTRACRAIVDLQAGKEYNFVMEVENNQRGAAKAQLYWKTPQMFEKEKTKEQRSATRSVYLPTDQQWFDFWTGTTLQGGQTIVADAPIDKIPLLIKAGTILPMGPFLQYSTEKAADTLELRIYSGANADITLYEDENDSYNYEKGIYATIEMHWDDTEKILTIEKQKGEFPGMLKERQLKIVLVSEDHGTGIDMTQKADKVVNYSGDKIDMKL